MVHKVPRVKLQFSQLELKVGPTLTHGMMSLGRKIKIMTNGDMDGIFESLMRVRTKLGIVFISLKRPNLGNGWTGSAESAGS